MKKLKIDFRRLLAVFIEHPGVSIMLVYTCISFSLNFTASEGMEDMEDWTLTASLKPLFLMPYCIIAALIADRHAGKFKLPANLAVLLIFLSAIFFPWNMIEWLEQPCYLVTAFYVMPLCLLIYKLDLTNDKFSRSTVNLIWSAFISLAIGLLTFLLLGGIDASFRLLFGLSVKFIDSLIPDLSFFLAAPLFFLYLTDHDGEEESLAKIFRIVSEYIVTPALLIYSAVLLGYGAKILFTWNLPHGGVSVMCFIWALVFFYVMMADRAFDFKHMKWVRHLRWAAIPLLIMLWIAVTRRISDYGYTSGRYCLVLCGLMATIYSALELLKVEKGYYAVAATGVIIFLGAVTMPGLNYKAVTLRSQVARVNKVLESKDSLSQEQIEQIKSSWELIKDLDETKLEKLSITEDELKSLTGASEKKWETCIYLKRDGKKIPIDGFTLLKQLSYADVQDGIMTIDGRKFNLKEITQKQLHESGLTEPLTKAQLEEVKSHFMFFDEGDIRLLWINGRNLNIRKDGSLEISEHDHPDYILFK